MTLKDQSQRSKALVIKHRLTYVSMSSQSVLQKHTSQHSTVYKAPKKRELEHV